MKPRNNSSLLANVQKRPPQQPCVRHRYVDEKIQGAKFSRVNQTEESKSTSSRKAAKTQPRGSRKAAERQPKGSRKAAEQHRHKEHLLVEGPRLAEVHDAEPHAATLLGASDLPSSERVPISLLFRTVWYEVLYQISSKIEHTCIVHNCIVQLDKVCRSVHSMLKMSPTV